MRLVADTIHIFPSAAAVHDAVNLFRQLYRGFLLFLLRILLQDSTAVSDVNSLNEFDLWLKKKKKSLINSVLTGNVNSLSPVPVYPGRLIRTKEKTTVHTLKRPICYATLNCFTYF